MNKPLLALLALLACSPLRAEPRLDGASASIPRNLASSAGGLSGGGGLTLDAAVGEAAVSTFSSAGGSVFSGLMNEIAQPGTITSLVDATKDTGTLELSWSAPGLDGLVGSVLSGYWRIDSSSDPAHVFAPTTYVTELATTVAPGTSQYFTLSGLLPNTTYYSRIYLADARKSFAETSAPSAESTLAKAPVGPALAQINASSVTISWTVPAGGDEGYVIDASTTDFGALSPGGVVVTSRTPNGLAVSLTVVGLACQNTYYFDLGSLNWQSQANFDAVFSTATNGIGVSPIQNLALSVDAMNRRVTVTWTNPVFCDPSGVTIVLSSNPISSALLNGTAYPVGTLLSDGSVVRSSAPTPAASYVESSLTLDVTGYFALAERDASNNYAAYVTTFVVLDLPPMAPAAIAGALNAGGSSITLNWWQVTSKLDGTSFKVPASPQPYELIRYDVYRSTGIVAPGWVYVGSAPVSASVFVASVPAPGSVYYYKIVSVDAYQPWSVDQAMIIDTLGDLFALDGDQLTRIQIPASAAGFIQPGGNPTGRPLLVRANDRPADLGGRVVKSVSFDPVISPSNQPAAVPPADAPSMSVALHYDTIAGQIVPSAVGALSLSPQSGLNPAINASDASQWLSAYYVDGQNSAKLFGSVDSLSQTVQVQAPYVGNYQIRTTARTQDFSFDLSGVSNKAITPNGDGLNDTVVFTFDNPRDSAVSGEIFDIRGRKVCDLAAGPVAGASLIWDGKSRGVVVPRGVYIYQIKAEGKTFSGTVVVIR